MWRTFRAQALTGAAQPIFGDKLTAAMAVPIDGVDPIITVADTTIYWDGDRITIDPDLANADTVRIIKRLTATTMQVNNEGAPLHAHAVNAIIALSIPATEIIVSIKSRVGAGSIFLGTDNTVTNAGGGNVIYEVLPGYPFRDTYTSNWNTERTDDLWMAGGISDSAIVAAQVV